MQTQCTFVRSGRAKQQLTVMCPSREQAESLHTARMLPQTQEKAKSQYRFEQIARQVRLCIYSEVTMAEAEEPSVCPKKRK
jgi:hypothetical protein